MRAKLEITEMLDSELFTLSASSIQPMFQISELTLGGKSPESHLLTVIFPSKSPFQQFE